MALPKKPGKPCARCGRTYREHETGAVGSCSRYRFILLRAKRVRTGIERAMSDNEGEK
jgi:uncharacterized protein YcbX